MNQVSSKLRREENGYAHWCPGCEEMHTLPDSWAFNGNINSPSFTPSFKHQGLKCIWKGTEWTGEWQRDAEGNTIPYVCHYVLTDGKLNYQGDCTHSLSGKVIDLPDLPTDLTDEVQK